MIGQSVAKHAFTAIGTPFRIHGRVAGQALDCAGLVEQCLNQSGISLSTPLDYAIRGNHHDRTVEFFAQPQFRPIAEAEVQDGDIAAVQCGPRQVHLMIRTGKGWVHAHAGLGRVVFTPDPIIWPTFGIWRPQGE